MSPVPAMQMAPVQVLGSTVLGDPPKLSNPPPCLAGCRDHTRGPRITLGVSWLGGDGCWGMTPPPGCFWVLHPKAPTLWEGTPPPDSPPRKVGGHLNKGWGDPREWGWGWGG